MSTDTPVKSEKSDVEFGSYKYGFHDSMDNYAFKSRKGLDPQIVRQISEMKGEPAWMTDFRLESLAIFESRPMPNWGGDMTDLNFQDIFYYMKAANEQETSGKMCRKRFAELTTDWGFRKRKRSTFPA